MKRRRQTTKRQTSKRIEGSGWSQSPRQNLAPLGSSTHTPIVFPPTSRYTPFSKKQATAMKRSILPTAAAVALISTFVGSANAAWEDHDSSVRQYDLGPPMLSNALQWVSTGCPDGIDYCGMLEFCEDTSDFPNVVFGYRHPCLDDEEECECDDKCFIVILGLRLTLRPRRPQRVRL